jgi:hypothetical protein
MTDYLNTNHAVVPVIAGHDVVARARLAVDLLQRWRVRSLLHQVEIRERAHRPRPTGDSSRPTPVSSLHTAVATVAATSTKAAAWPDDNRAHAASVSRPSTASKLFVKVRPMTKAWPRRGRGAVAQPDDGRLRSGPRPSTSCSSHSPAPTTMALAAMTAALLFFIFKNQFLVTVYLKNRHHKESIFCVDNNRYKKIDDF